MFSRKGTMREDHGMHHQKTAYWASLVAQWLGVCLLMQGTRVRALVWEDPTCHGAAGPVSHDCWACASGACAPRRGGAAMVKGPRTAMKSGPRTAMKSGPRLP